VKTVADTAQITVAETSAAAHLNLNSPPVHEVTPLLSLVMIIMAGMAIGLMGRFVCFFI
jgi:hypothetical protein